MLSRAVAASARPVRLSPSPQATAVRPARLRPLVASPRTLAPSNYSTQPLPDPPVTSPPDPRYPPSPAYYTGNHQYYDLLYSLQSHLGGIQAAQSAVSQVLMYPTAYDPVRRSFKSRDALSFNMNLSLTQLQYDSLIAHLIAIYVGPVNLSHVSSSPTTMALSEDDKNRLRAKLVQEALTQTTNANNTALPLLHPFLNPIAAIAQLAKRKKPDKFGRAFATGSRKTSRAHTWVVPGNGQFFVNGIPITDYFLRREVESVTFPLQVANAFGKFNIWTVVKGGGPTGQADATSVAVARALAIHVPEAIDDLTATGLMDNDTRQVERKKPGQKKARKKFAWVKR